MPTRRAPIDVDLRLDDRPIASETRSTMVGPDVVVIETAIPAAGVALTLTSSYLGCPGTDTIASHASAMVGIEPRSWSTRTAEDLLPVWTAQDRCVLDHVSVLQDLLTEMGHVARIEVLDLGSLVTRE